MSVVRTRSFLWLIIWLFSVHAAAQTSSRTHNLLVGCYETSSLTSVPADLATRGVPQFFELTDRPTPFGNPWLQMKAADATTEPSRLHHIWTPRHGSIKLQFGWGMGGWEGTLKPAAPNEFVGKLKPFCNGRCGGQKQVVSVHVKRVECSK